MKWVSPLAFYLIFVFVLALLFNLFRTVKSRATLQFSSGLLIKDVTPGWRAQLSFIPIILKTMALVFAVFALARPQQSNSKVNKNVEGIDIMLVLDVSDSMEIEDMTPLNRITAAKSVIHKFIQGRGNDRIGLIIFAGESYTRCPLTLDYDVLFESLDTVTTDNIKQGTAIGVGLANAVARLKESTAKSRVVVLLTDGESNTGTIDPNTAIDIAKGYGIKVYTIGIGVNGQAQLPVYSTDAFGNKFKHYQPIHSTVNETLLQTAAEETGGKFFRAVDTEALIKVFATIDSLEKTKIQINQYVKYTELFDAYLFWGIALYFLQLLLSRFVFRRAP